MINRERFDELVAESLDALPDEFAKLLENVEIIVEDTPSSSKRREIGLSPDEEILGLYEGVPLTKRGVHYGLVLPDTITIYRQPIESSCKTESEIKKQVRKTVLHEVAHFFGIDDRRLDELDR
jgi:predicted Zn-dependent protease with MMP-like domain